MKRGNFNLRLNRKKYGFTLVELLVVISIIALLLAILMPALSRAKQQALRVKCGAQLKQVGIAFYAYMSDNQGWLPPNETQPVGSPPSWQKPYWQAHFCGLRTVVEYDRDGQGHEYNAIMMPYVGNNPWMFQCASSSWYRDIKRMSSDARYKDYVPWHKPDPSNPLWQGDLGANAPWSYMGYMYAPSWYKARKLDGRDDTATRNQIRNGKAGLLMQDKIFNYFGTTTWDNHPIIGKDTAGKLGPGGNRMRTDGSVFWESFKKNNATSTATRAKALNLNDEYSTNPPGYSYW